MVTKCILGVKSMLRKSSRVIGTFWYPPKRIFPEIVWVTSKNCQEHWIYKERWQYFRFQTHGFLQRAKFTKLLIDTQLKMPSELSCNIPDNIYLFKFNNRITRKRCEIRPKTIIKTAERHWRRSGVFIVNFEHIWHLFRNVSIVELEQVNVSWA